MSPGRRRLLLIDDDRLLCRAIQDTLGQQVEVLSAHTAAEGLAACAAGPLDVVVLDQKLPDAEGHRLCQRILEAQATAKLIFVTAYPSFDNAVKAIQAGAYDYLCKPFELEALALSVRRCLATLDLERGQRIQAYRAGQDGERAVLVGGPELGPIRELIELAAGAEAPVLVTGETGTGKNLVAKAIHYAGPRRHRPFISLSCAALPENLIEAELLGWERGAYTGAVEAREGVLELADGGTLFLDEIGELPLHLQAKLLSVLEEREVKRLGGRTPRAVDVRVVAATNAELDERVAARTFRPDLYYRLNVLRVHLPPLRQRRSSLAPLCQHLLQRLAGRGLPPRLGDGELERLEAYPWPGNVRELRNILERAFVLHRDPLRPSELLGPTRPVLRPGPPASEGPPLTLGEVERRHVERVLAHHRGNLARTSKALDISLSTLKRKLREWRPAGVGSTAGRPD